MNKTQLQKVRDALWLPENSTDEEFAQFSEAFAILDRALAAPEPEPVAYWDGESLALLPADLENIPNWSDYYRIPLYRHPAPQSAQPFCYVSVNAQGDVTSTVKRKDKWRKIPLYTAPPSREFVGLTDEEIQPINITYGFQDRFTGYARAIEDALRAKNLGEQA